MRHSVDTVKTATDAAEVDELLWRVLWQPIGLPRDVRSEFSIAGEEIELVAREDGRVVGGLVAVWTDDLDVELRHLAVAVQRHGIGRSLVNELFRIVALRKGHRIRTIARSTSAGFFRELGFLTVARRVPEHPVFVKHGITFELMERIVEPGVTFESKA